MRGQVVGCAAESDDVSATIADGFRWTSRVAGTPLEPQAQCPFLPGRLSQQDGGLRRPAGVRSGSTCAIGRQRHSRNVCPQIRRAAPYAGVANTIGAGLVTDRARQGGNITAFTGIGTEVSGKRLELLKQVAPRRECGTTDGPLMSSRSSSLRAIGDISTPRRHRLLGRGNEIGRTGSARPSRTQLRHSRTSSLRVSASRTASPYAARIDLPSKGFLQRDGA